MEAQGNVQQRAEQLDRSKFFGVPISGFENAGRQQFILLLMSGLTPASKVVDIGCGVLRAGYWLIHFLDPHCYYGLEPSEERIKAGLTTILEPGIEQMKQPRFAMNADFDTGVFGVPFDFFLAYSIWTHASKGQIGRMLDGFLRDSTPQAVFLASVIPAGLRWRDYPGEAWVGTSHESVTPGCIGHDLKWIRAECRRRSLSLRILGRELDGQTWLQISRDRKRNLLFRSIWLEGRVMRAVRRLIALVAATL
jgi:hypothetical protein